MMLNVFDDYKMHQVTCKASAELKANTLMQKMTWLMEQAGPHQAWLSVEDIFDQRFRDDDEDGVHDYTESNWS